jgi:hypothetical protein
MESSKAKMIQMEKLMMDMQVQILIRFQGLIRYIYKTITVLEILSKIKKCLKNNFKLKHLEMPKNINK